MINPTTHAITEFPVPTASAGPDGITAGPDGNLWFAEGSVTGSKIGQFVSSMRPVPHPTWRPRAVHPRGRAGRERDVLHSP